MGEQLKDQSLPGYLRIDEKREVSKISKLLLHELERLNKQGVVIGLSGGLDSSVCATLCVKTLGRKKVHTYILPERDSAKENIKDAAMVARDLGLQPVIIDITPFLKKLGVYDLISKEQANNLSLIQSGYEWIRRITKQPSPFGFGIAHLYGKNQGQNKAFLRILSKPLQSIQNFSMTKVRARMIVLYYHAMLHNCLLIGTTDKSEWQIGFYDKYGDGANDVAILRHLYKTQIRELAKYLGINRKIIEKPSSGDLAANLPNEVVIGLTYPQLDSILWGLEHELSEHEIIMQTKVNKSQVKAVKELKEITKLREELPSHL